MEIQLILSIVTIVLLMVAIVLLFVGKKKSDICEIIELLKRTADEQRESVQKQISNGTTAQFERFGVMQESTQTLLQSSRSETNEQLGKFAIQIDTRLSSIGEHTQKTLQDNREEINKQLREFGEQLDGRLSSMARSNAENIEKINATLEIKMKSLQESNEKRLEQMQGVVFERFRVMQESTQTLLQASRSEINEQLGKFATQIDTRLSSIGEHTQKTLQDNRAETNKQLREFGEQLDGRLSSMARSNAENIEKINATLEAKMKSLQESNEKRLEQMQGVVDEKLQKTLETRLSQSFELVGKQLDNVQQGLGEMKSLAADAKSLKNALMNVKERGTYGEVRLEKLLSDILAPSQYDVNVEITGGKRVEFAIKLPGNGNVPLLLPIDSKFPIEDYNRLLDAEDKSAIDEARKSFASKIRVFAKDIHDKYIIPPTTTDFALMFLPTEGLYAEVLQNAALFEEMRDKYKVTPVGATTLAAFLSSLQMGFKTLAIEQRSQDVWDTLRAVKKQFSEFETLLAQAHKQLQTADNTIEKIVGIRTRAIKRALKDVEVLVEGDNVNLLERASEDSE